MMIEPAVTVSNTATSVSWKTLAGIFGTYFLANRIALIFPDAENILAVIWPAAGIGLASLLLTPRKSWLMVLGTIFLAGNIANLTAGRPLFNSLGFMTANVLESWGCALVLVRMCGQDIRFCRMRDIVALGVGATLVNALSAIVGAGTAAIAGLAPFYTFWRTWLIADGLGIFLITPLVVVCFRSSDNARTKRRRMLEITAFFALYLVLSFFTFRNLSPDFDLNPGPYALIALLIWPALRLGTRAVMLSVNLLAVTAVLHVVQHFGSFEQGTPSSETHLLLVQLYIWCAAITAFTLHALSKQRDATEASLQQSMEWFQALISQSQDGIMVLRNDGRPCMVNDRACDNLGYSQEEFMRLHLQDWDPDINERNDPVTLWGNLPVTIEARHQRKDGTIFPVELTISRIESPEGLLIMGIVRDITERKAAERKLISSEERLEMALRGANAGLWDWNVQTGELVINDRWAEMLGYSRAELHPVSVETWRRLCHPEDLIEAERLLWQQLGGETDFYLCELRMKHKDGRWIWIQDSGKGMEWTADGKPLRMVGTHVDISARKQSEELREDVERIIRHDLRAPAGSAVSVARLLAESPDLSGEDRMLAMQLERSGQDMLDTLNLSLEMQKIESGSARYQFEDIPLLLLINEIIDGLRLRPEHRKKHFDVMIDPFGTVRGVPFLMRMALQNIIQNAVEAVSAGETVYVLAAFGTQIAISVRNNGVIPEAIRSRFFEKYVTHGKSNGTGLGTYSSKLLTEAQGGSIFMDSSTLTGKTELTLTFPAATS